MEQQHLGRLAASQAEPVRGTDSHPAPTARPSASCPSPCAPCNHVCPLASCSTRPATPGPCAQSHASERERASTAAGDATEVATCTLNEPLTSVCLPSVERPRDVSSGMDYPAHRAHSGLDLQRRGSTAASSSLVAADGVLEPRSHTFLTRSGSSCVRPLPRGAEPPSLGRTIQRARAGAAGGRDDGAVPQAEGVARGAAAHR